MNKAILNAARRSNSVDGHQAYLKTYGGGLRRALPELRAIAVSV